MPLMKKRLDLLEVISSDQNLTATICIHQGSVLTKFGNHYIYYLMFFQNRTFHSNI